MMRFFTQLQPASGDMKRLENNRTTLCWVFSVVGFAQLSYYQLCSICKVSIKQLLSFFFCLFCPLSLFLLSHLSSLTVTRDSLQHVHQMCSHPPPAYMSSQIQCAHALLQFLQFYRCSIDSLASSVLKIFIALSK